MVTQCVAADQNSGSTANGVHKWNIQVQQVDAGDVNLDPAFQVAIYENLITELEKTKKFEQVYRSGDRRASAQNDLLVLKIEVKKFDAGSETKRAVTTVAGATKLKVEYSLRTPGGQVVKQEVVNASVRFIGNNMRVTHNLASSIAKAVKKSTIPETSASMSQYMQQLAQIDLPL
ncbi:MAG: hypothetical protein C5B46_03995 [Proteobacteria bacterium]|nr:MAG: hypothetical protein C5B46_03995 [Pseudomonadota bacterium]